MVRLLLWWHSSSSLPQVSLRSSAEFPRQAWSRSLPHTVNPSDRRPPKKDTLWLWFRHLKHKEPFEKSWTGFGHVTWCGRVAGCGRWVSGGTWSLNWTLDVTPAADVCTSPDGSVFKKNDFILFFLFQGKNFVEKCRRKSHDPTLLFLHSEHFVSFSSEESQKPFELENKKI